MRTFFGILLVASMLGSGCVGGQSAALAPQTSAMSSTGPIDADHGGVTGAVTDDSLTPLPGVTVGVVAGPSLAQATTDDAGKFTVGGLLPGKYTLGAQKLGYQSSAKTLDLTAGQTAEVTFTLVALPAETAARHQTLIGQGYFACGAYLIVTTWGNLDACKWDQHRPKYDFNVTKAGIKDILEEVSWIQNSGVTSKLLVISIKYKQVCDPFCDQEGEWPSNGVQGTNPVRNFVNFEPEAKKVKEDPMPLSSVTFPGGEGPTTSPPSAGSGPVIVFQQKMTHYVTMFWGEHCGGDPELGCPKETFTAIGDG